jgi:hypothetical protein
MKTKAVSTFSVEFTNYKHRKLLTFVTNYKNRTMTQTRPSIRQCCEKAELVADSARTVYCFLAKQGFIGIAFMETYI